MREISEFQNEIEFLLTDIDDTLTDEGLLHAESFSALWDLADHGVKIIPVTGRPAGWCEMIARLWPVAGVVGENGGFYFRYHNKKMKRHFVFDHKIQTENQKKLEKIKTEVLSSVPGCAVASDQFCRLMDLAIDFCEDVPALPESAVDQIVSIFKKHGAIAKVSSIHVNGWFGEYDKLSQSLNFLNQEFGIDKETAKKVCAFSGDSPNDEPMFQYFPNSFAVANIKAFAHRITHKPQYVATKKGGDGFVQIAQAIKNSLPKQ